MYNKNKIGITAIHTDSGKTLISALCCRALGWDYFKPIQAGTPTDSDQIAQWTQAEKTKIHPEGVRLAMPASPHIAAFKEGITLSIETISFPKTENGIIIEGAGGLMVPINNKEFVSDFFIKHDIPVILVSNYYLGSINHSLLSAAWMKARGIHCLGIILNGTPMEGTKEAIEAHSSLPVIASIPMLDTRTTIEIEKEADNLRPHLLTAIERCFI